MEEQGAFQTMKAIALPVGITGAVMLSMIGLTTGYPCVSVGLQHGLWLEQCPATDLRATADLQLNHLARGRWGQVEVRVQVMWRSAKEQTGELERAPVPGAILLLDLVNEEGELVSGVELRNPVRSRDVLAVELKLPDVPDGTYQLRAKIDASFETIEVFAPMALFTPALVHVASDRPLYKPGQEVLLRAAVLSREQNIPVDLRPGVWSVISPSGVEMLHENARTDGWGVSASSFPLAVDAEEGRWRVRFTTGEAVREEFFEVRPFKLPRFTVDVEPNQSWYGLDDTVVLEGSASYTSGAPVANAMVEMKLSRREGSWPLPLAWEEPFVAQTDARGRYRFQLGDVPGDLNDRSSLVATVSVTDEAGEQQKGSGRLLLSVDALRVMAVTPFRGGLVGSANNRAYLRVMKPDGQPLAHTEVVVSNPYQPQQEVMKTVTDADGVASLQLDPGEPVTIVTPPPPVRLRPFVPAPPHLLSGQVFPEGRSLELSERRSLDRLHPTLARCGVFAIGDSIVDVGLQVSAGGRVVGVQSQRGELGSCVERGMWEATFSPGGLRSMKLQWSLPDGLFPRLDLGVKAVAGSDSQATEALKGAALRARQCFSRGVGVDGATVLEVQWRHPMKADRIETTVQMAQNTGLSAPTLACVEREFRLLTLDEPTYSEAMGSARLQLHVPVAPGSVRQPALTSTGFQLKVAASSDGEALGTTKVSFPVGELPELRLRASPTLTSPKETVAIELLRGPTYRGELPEKVVLRQRGQVLKEVEFEAGARRASITLPRETEGFVYLEAGSARTVLFVQPSAPLAVHLSTDAKTYHPGDSAKLTVTTMAGDSPVEASVMLAGVDSALSQLSPLMPVTDWGRITVDVSGDEAFAAFGPRDLQVGGIRGENAAQAALLLVTDLPTDVEVEEVSSRASYSPPLEEVLITNFYRGQEALVGLVREWEGLAKEGDLLDPPTVARLWRQVLRESATAGEPIVDGFGRPLLLGLLPHDLLVQLAPAQVVLNSTHLSEDVINWPRWVGENP